MLGSPIEVRDPSRAGGVGGRELPAFLKGTVLDPDYVPPQRSADDAHGGTYGNASGEAGRQNARQQFLHGRSTEAGHSTDGPRSTEAGSSADSPTDAGRSSDAGRCTSGCSAGLEGSGEPVGSGVLVTEFRQLACRIAVADLPEGCGLCVGETEELLFARDRLDSAIAARVGRVHVAGEARSAGSGGHASTGTWLRASAGMSDAGASRLIRLATQLARLPLVRDRFASGTLAEGSVEAISQITTHLTDAQAALAEPILLDLADHASPAEIGKAGRYLRELLDPGTLEADAETDYAARFLLVRPSSTGGVEGEFRLPREAGARLREFLTAYARPKGKDDDRPLRVRQADALSALLSKKVTTELLVLVRAESLPTDHPAHDHPTTSHPTTDHSNADHPTHDADSTHTASTHTASTAASGTPAMPATGAPSSPSTSGRADTPDPDTAAADTADPNTANPDTANAHTANAHTAGSSDTRPGTAQAGDGSTCRASGPRHTGSTGSARAGADSTDVGPARAGTGSTDTGPARAGADNTDTGSARAGADSASTGSAGAGTSSASTGSAGASASSMDTGSAEVGVGSVGAGEGPVSDACRTCGHAPDRLAPGLLIATGQLLPISDVHRLARTSRLVRLVVNAQGQVLDMGRAVRLATPAQRRAVLARYATCYREGCPIPADMAEIDHVQGWAEGGTTDLDLLAPACTWHNRDKATHPDRYRTRRNHDGTWTLLYHGKRNRFAGRFRR
ncbi:hypothetical protein GCM10009555_048890 [Acrocarpospora macrocephala]